MTETRVVDPAKSAAGKLGAAARLKHSNGALKRKERIAGTEWIRNKIKAGILISRLNKAASGKLDLSKAQIDAAKILLDKAMPSLQAVEQTVVNPLDQLSAEEMEDQARALITSHVGLVCSVLDSDPAFRASIQAHLAGRPVVVEQQTAVAA